MGNRALYSTGLRWVPFIGGGEPIDVVDTSGRLTLAQREAQTLGNLLTPPGPRNTGLLAGTNRTDLIPFNPGSASTINLTVANATYTNRIFWGTVQFRAAGITLSNCLIAGPDPALRTDVNVSFGAIRNFGDGYFQHTMKDCVIDPGAWMDVNLVRPGGAAPTPLLVWRKNMAPSLGLWGGRSDMTRVEITNCQDGTGMVQSQSAVMSPTGVAADDPSYVAMRGCWVHANIRYKGPAYTASIGTGGGGDDGTHSDCFQTNTGRNITLIGNYFGGVRDEYGYSRPGTETDPQFNSGDDTYNACLMIKQEGTTEEIRQIRNVVIERNFFEGGGDAGYNINHFFSTVRPNLMAPMNVTDNYFVRKPSSKYIIRHTNFASYYTNNRVVNKSGSGVSDRTFVLAEVAPITNG